MSSREEVLERLLKEDILEFSGTLVPELSYSPLNQHFSLDTKFLFFLIYFYVNECMFEGLCLCT